MGITLSRHRGEIEQGKPLVMESGKGAVKEFTGAEQAAAFRAFQNRALELLIEDRPLNDALEELMRAVEGRSATGVLGSILLLEGSNLRHGAGPSLPDAYNAAIDGIAIGPAVGSCGTAAYSGAPVYVSDIGSSLLWADFRELALAHDLRACWSTPIISGISEVLGTFAMYYREPREPSPEDLAVVDLITRTAALIIERRRSEATLRETAERYRLASLATNDAVWDWHFSENHVTWNAALETAYGHPPADVEPTGDWWMAHIHPDDRAQVDASHSRGDRWGCRELDGRVPVFAGRWHVCRGVGPRAHYP